MRTTLLKFVLLFSLVLLNTSLSTGQIQYNNIRFKQLSIAEGLPHNTINAITQDNHGFIWFGTRNGLCRYDGYNINLFAHNEADSTSLRHNFITRLYNDSLRNILWISTDQGICSYNYETEDFSRYQTIYSREEKTGSVAAPTAGLHFTDELRETLRRRGFQWAEVTLYVGYGTFSPVRCEDIRNHQMHREYVELPEETANAIAEAKARHRPVIAVGTTSVRTLEGVAQVCGRAQPFAGWTDIFLYPGRPFRVVDGIITNFHLPESSLLMLVSAFAGRKRILEAYQEAVKEGYRFFSYGDAMLIR